MTDKISNFRRINEPRAMRMLEQLGHIQTSASSMRIEQSEMNQMLTPVFVALAKLKEPSLAERQRDVVRRSVEADTVLGRPAYKSEPVAQEADNLQTLTTQQLVDRMIACGAILAERRK